VLRGNSEAARARRAAVQHTKAALDSLIQLVPDRRVAMRDIDWLRAATAERPERAGLSAGGCCYRHSSAQRDRGTKHDFREQQGPSLRVNTRLGGFYWLCLGQKAAMLTPTKNPA
jgi:uncharacterized protein (DUF2235 family)